MKVNDRGTKKWTTIMMPEHIEMLNKMWDEREYKEMPEIDEQQMQEIEINIQAALRDDLKVIIKYYADKDYKNIEGYLIYVDALNKKLYIEDTQIELQYVIDVNIL